MDWIKKFEVLRVFRKNLATNEPPSMMLATTGSGRRKDMDAATKWIRLYGEATEQYVVMEVWEQTEEDD